MKPRKRLTREESKELTRLRLIEAAERLFIRRGFDDASVEEISEMAGILAEPSTRTSTTKNRYSSQLSTGGGQRPSTTSLERASEPVERMAIVRGWFSNQWRLKDFIALRMEFSRRAFRDRSVRTHLAELLRRELETYSASVGPFLCAKEEVAGERPEIVALALLAVALGLGILAADTDPEREPMYAEAAALAFDRMTVSQISHLGQLQC